MSEAVNGAELGAPTDSLDQIADDLQELRQRAGNVPYSAIVQKIADARQERGVAAYAARPARSTVYDVFRHGRRRINVELVVEIVVALGQEADQAEAWRQRCIDAQRRLPQRPLTMPEAPLPEDAAPGEPAPGPVPSPSGASPEPSTEPAQPEAPDLPDAEPAASTDTTPADSMADSAYAAGVMSARRFGPWGCVLAAAVCLGVNMLGMAINMGFQFKLYLDMVGTACAALVLGPWYGVIVALLTNTLQIPFTGLTGLGFAPVNIAGALVWGYAFRRIRATHTASGFLLLSVAVAVVCSLVAVPCIFFMAALDPSAFHRLSGEWAPLWQERGLPPVLAVLVSNLATSTLDKMVTAALSMGAVQAIARSWPGMIPVDFSDRLTHLLRRADPRQLVRWWRRNRRRPV